MKKAFAIRYELWQQDARQELRDMGHHPDTIRQARICENGQVYLHRGGLCTITIEGYITPWNKSKYYIS